MDVQGLGSVATSGSTTKQSAQVLDKDSFMKLFVAQMQNQDPLKPMDGQDLAAQLAQFSSLEQLYQMNKGMSDLIAYQTSQNNLNLLSLIGKKVEVDSDELTLRDGKTSEAWYRLGEGASSCVVNIYDENGACVRTMNLGAKKAGSYGVSWDGRTRSGEVLSDGRYYFEVIARGSYGEEVPVTRAMSTRIAGVNFDGAQSHLVTDDGVEISVSDITKVENTNEIDSLQQEKE